MYVIINRVIHISTCIILICVLCVCVLWDLGNIISYCRASFTSIKSSWWVAQTAWRVLYSNAKWWTHRLFISTVSVYDVRNHAHHIAPLPWILKPAVCSLLHVYMERRITMLISPAIRALPVELHKLLAWTQSGKHSICFSQWFNIQNHTIRLSQVSHLHCLQ